MIRRLRAGDERRLQELCRRFKERVPSEEQAASFLGRGDHHVWVAEANGELAGFAYAYVLLRVDGDRSVFLYELGVDGRFRRRGLGRALVDEARLMAEQAGARKMWVGTSYDNEAGKRTYAAAGGEPSTEPTLAYTWRLRQLDDGSVAPACPHPICDSQPANQQFCRAGDWYSQALQPE
jgi:GNAT superfamily N-acetyltransferase